MTITIPAWLAWTLLGLWSANVLASIYQWSLKRQLRKLAEERKRLLAERTR